MRFIVILALLLAYGCASSPEARLKQGYDTASSAVVTATVLLERKQISSDEALRVLSMGETAKATLDAGKEALRACREAGETQCSGATVNINLGAGVLLEIERYLEAQQ